MPLPICGVVSVLYLLLVDFVFPICSMPPILHVFHAIYPLSFQQLLFGFLRTSPLKGPSNVSVLILLPPLCFQHHVLLLASLQPGTNCFPLKRQSAF